MKVNLALQIIPLVEPNKVFGIVDQAIEVIKQSGIKYQVTPFETVIEGELDILFELVKKVQDACFNHGSEEIITNIKIHSSKDKSIYIEEKMNKYL